MGPVAGQSSATFGNIHEGSYTFKVKARSPDGIWSEPVTYSFKVLAESGDLKDTGKEELLKAIEKIMVSNEKYISNELNLNLYHHLGLNKNNTSSATHLTPRETEIIQYIANGMTNHEIAAKLLLSTSTVDTHRKNILAKLSLKNSAALVKYAAENNLL